MDKQSSDSLPTPLAEPQGVQPAPRDDPMSDVRQALDADLWSHGQADLHHPDSHSGSDKGQRTETAIDDGQERKGPGEVLQDDRPSRKYLALMTVACNKLKEEKECGTGWEVVKVTSSVHKETQT